MDKMNFYVVRVDGNSMDVGSGGSLMDAVDRCLAEDTSILEFIQVEARSTTEAEQMAIHATGWKAITPRAAQLVPIEEL